MSSLHPKKKPGRPARPGFHAKQGPADVIEILGIPEDDRAWVELEVRAIP